MGNVTPPAGARALSSHWRERLVRRLRIDLRFDLCHPQADPWPPGAMEYYARFTVSWDQEEAARSGPDDARILDGLARHAPENDDGYLTVPVGAATFLIADLCSTSLFLALDDRSDDLAHIGRVLLNPGKEGLADDLREQIEGHGDGLIIVPEAHVTEPWRGVNLGLIAIGLSLQHLSRGCALAALHPMEPRLEGAQARSQAHQRLGTHWSRLGFRPFRDQIFVLDLARNDLDEHLRALLRRS